MTSFTLGHRFLPQLFVEVVVAYKDLILLYFSFPKSGFAEIDLLILPYIFPNTVATSSDCIVHGLICNYPSRMFFQFESSGMSLYGYRYMHMCTCVLMSIMLNIDFIGIVF